MRPAVFQSSRPLRVSAVASWPQFQYNAAHTGYNPLETTIGPGNVANLKLLWKASTGGAAAGIGGVSVTGGQAFLGTYSDATLRAWDTADGSLDWSAVTSGGLESTPAIGGGRAFVESNNGILYGFNAATGAELWSQSIGGAATSPALVKGVVYAAGYFTMHAYDAATGTPLWTATLPGLVRSAPAVAGGRVFVSTEVGGPRDRNLVALNPSTGAVLWTKPVGQIQLASPIVGGNTVYLCSANGLYALYATHGYIRWSRPGGCNMDTTPALAQGVLYTDSQASGVMAFSASTGALLWSAGTGDNTAPTVANGVLYAPTGTGTIAAYDVTTHALFWTSPAHGFYGPFAVVNGVLYAGGQDGLYAFGL